MADLSDNLLVGQRGHVRMRPRVDRKVGAMKGAGLQEDVGAGVLGSGQLTCQGKEHNGRTWT